MSDLGVRVLDRDGNPIEGASVSVSMRRHAFGFGTAVDARYLLEETAPGDRYRERIVQLFNLAVLEHRHKWKPWETPVDRRWAIEASKWLIEQGLDLRGHAVIWQRLDQPVVPDDVVEKMESGDDDRAEYIARRARNHVTDIVGHHQGDMVEWDVLNEQLTEHRLTDVVNPEAPSHRPPEAVRWFKLARRADPEAALYVNELNVITGSDDTRADRYEELVSYLLANGAALDGVGIQAHHRTPAEARSPEAVLETLDRFARHGVTMQITEYDTYGDDWTEERAATHLRMFLQTVFSHPVVEGFVMWGFWDGAHWQDSAPLFREDWSKKPALDVYRSLVFDEWWTDEKGRTGKNGVFRTDVFLGDHEITAAIDGVSSTMEVSVMDPDAVPTIEIRLADG